MPTDMRVLTDAEVDAVAGGHPILIALGEGGAIVVAGGLMLAGVAVGGLLGVGVAGVVSKLTTATDVNTSLAEVIEGGEQPPDPAGDDDQH